MGDVPTDSLDKAFLPVDGAQRGRCPGRWCALLVVRGCLFTREAVTRGQGRLHHSPALFCCPVLCDLEQVTRLLPLCTLACRARQSPKPVGLPCS